MVTSIEANLLNAESYSNATREVLDNGGRTLDTANETSEVLDTLLSVLTARVEDHATQLDRQTPANYPSLCELGPMEGFTCLNGELHSKYLELNSSLIDSQSISTRLYAREFLNNLVDPSFVDFDGINRTAMEAISIGVETLNGLEQTGIDELAVDVNQTREDVESLSTNVSTLLADARISLDEAETELNRSTAQQRELADIESDIATIEADIEVLQQTDNYTAESVTIVGRMVAVQDQLDIINVTLIEVQERVSSVEERVIETISTVRDTEELLDYSEEQGMCRKRCG